MKKGQVAIIIIIGIVIIISAIYVFSSRNLARNQESFSLDNYADQMKSYIEKCMFEETVPAIYLQGVSGGYFDDAPAYGQLGETKIAYWYKDGKDISPTIEILEANLAEYLKEKFITCTDFSNMESVKGLSIIKPNDYSVKAKILINDKEVEVEFLYPLKISLDNAERESKSYTTKVFVPLGADFNMAKKALANAAAAKEYYDLEKDCGDFTKINQLTNIYFANDIFQINDYSSFYDKTFRDTFQFRFMTEGLKVYGKCSG
ncbi:MAG: hypothetical protein NDI94_01860 [Candidatus Woesearchaeota archaeon]|nr:hypothetical protein [Candidatus Woesearchaeota archaeon]